MKTRTIIWIGVTVGLALAAFAVGRLTRPVQGYNAVALAQDRALLLTLRAGDSTNAIQRLESYLDMTTYHSMVARPSLRGKERQDLDSILLKVAHYRDQVPRPIDTSPDVSPGGSKPATCGQFKTSQSEAGKS